MIDRIDKVENLGIFKPIQKSAIQDFNRYNLIYGWNGSGKSTLSRLFAILGNSTYDLDQRLKYTIIANNKKVTEKEVGKFHNIAVFNEDFVKENIDWDGILNSILLMDESNINEVKAYNSLKEELYGSDNNAGLNSVLKKKLESIEKQEKEISKTLSTIAKTVKEHYQVMETTNSYYMNYDKKKVQTLIENTEELLTKDDLLDEENLKAEIKKSKPLKKAKIEYEISKTDIEDVKTLISGTKEIVERKVSAIVIEELKNNIQISSWVNDGLELHKSNNLKKCAFCGADISDSRVEELEAHFNDALRKITEDIDKCKKSWEMIMPESTPAYTNISDYYDEYKQKLSLYNIEYAGIVENLTESIKIYMDALDLKKDKPFNKMEISKDDDCVELIHKMNELLKKYQKIIEEHNQKTDSFEDAIKIAQKKIERHYVQEQIISSEYREMLSNCEISRQEYNKETSIFRDKKEQYEALEIKISTETLGAEEFNEKLEKFLGHGEIKLRFAKEEKGYKIIRYDNEEAKNLSEGEKTAIAFIYFITKLKENGKKIEDYTLVIDDPISSFDSNKIFSAYAYLKSECNQAKQLFVMTHNYNFFSLVLGWFNKRHKNEQGKNVPDYSLYRIENRFEDGRRFAYLCDGGESMKQATEYDYVFYTVYSMKDKPLTKKDAIFCGNICRKFLESFLSFKFPKQRGDLLSLLEKGLPGKENDITREKIYKFVNIYSHDKKINTLEELDADILFANSESVIADIFKMIERLDKIHYDSMVEKVCKEIEM